jgi:hypothetical protein
MLRDDLGGIYVAVFSHLRATNVAKMTEQIGDATWFVGEGEGDAYRAAGAKHVVESGGLCRSRNAAIDAAQAHGATCLQMSDDLTRIQVAVRGEKKVVAENADFWHVVSLIQKGMSQVGAKLGGAAPTNNPFYANVDKPVHPSAFIVGDFLLIERGCSLRFDETMTLKEDYDYTLQHLMRYGVVARRDDVLLTQHYVDALQTHGVQHGFVVHPRMPALSRQRALVPLDGPLVLRWMLHPGYGYDEAKERYEPFERLAEPDPDNRSAIAELVHAAIAKSRAVTVVVNNKAEGCSPLGVQELARTIASLLATR